VESDAEIARHQLELARTTSDRLWEQYRSFAETLDPVRGVAGPEELRRLGEASDWTWKIYEAEHALFMAENGTPGVVGAHDDYQWLTMLECNIADFLRLCPEVVLDKYLAVTSIDSGTLQLSEQEKKDGWRTSDEVESFALHHGGIAKTVRIGRLPIALVLVRSLGYPTRRMKNAVPGLMSGLSSTDLRRLWKCKHS